MSPDALATAETKKVLRREMRRKRSEFVAGPGVDMDALGEQLAKVVLAHLPAGVRTIASYHAIGDEIRPARLDMLARQRGLQVALPRMPGEDQPLVFHAVSDPARELAAGLHNIPAPSANQPAVLPDVVLVPVLAVDQAGRRLGQGKGYYDRTLPGLRASRDVLVVAIAFETQVMKAVPAGPHDALMDAIATPERWIDCVAGA